MNNTPGINRLLSDFAAEMDKNKPLQEYPRPQLQRDSYINLNGLWDYAILKKGETLTAYQGKILVPFSPESILSGVERQVLPDDVLYYKTVFTIPEDFNKGRVLLHFGAVDYLANIFVNGNPVMTHRGGYFPFSAEITAFLKQGENTLTLTVTDPSDTGVQSRGKQKIKRGGIFYTPQSGIWQTVWLESVPEQYIQGVKITPDIDKEEVAFEVKGVTDGEITVFDEGKEICRAAFHSGAGVIPTKGYELWSPENPKLYDVTITSGLDTVKSYFGMRKFGLMKDGDGIMRLSLNNRPYFHNGLLDQGYYSDGLYTPPSDEAMLFDISTTKAAGFNMLRKHIKIEPQRWYYHCDRIGILVWQDMINGGGAANTPMNGIRGFFGKRVDDGKYAAMGREDEAGRKEYYEDAKRTIETLYNSVSLCMWVPFNESWGQFDAAKAYDFVKALDTTRLIDHASGWHDQGAGDFKSLHIYFTRIKVPKDSRAVILSEFGGYSVKLPGHVYNENRSFGYRKYKNLESLEKAYRKLYEKKIIPLIKKGLSATVYTQLTDVEDEINGIITYDRKVVKIDLEVLQEINSKLTY